MLWLWALGTALGGALSGSVREHGSGAPIAGAQVRVGEVVVTADERGRFTLDVEPGQALEVTAANYLPASVSVSESDMLVVRLVSAVEEVVVIGQERQDLAEHVVTVEELRRVPGSFGDPVRALQSLPSVSRTGDLSGELVVRGAEATNTAVYLDGMRVPFLYHLLVGRSIVDPALIEEVSFHPGAVPARFGNVTQAVVDARVGEGRVERGVHGTAHMDPLDGGASLMANLGRDTTLRASGRVGWAAALASVFLRGGGMPELTFPYEDHTLRLDHGDWSLSVIGAHDSLRYVPAGTSEQVEERAIRKAGYDPYLLVDAGFWRARARWLHTEGETTAGAWVIGGRDVQQNLVPLLGRMGAGGIQDARATQWNGTVGFVVDHPRIEVGGEAIVQPSRYEALGEEGVEPAIELVTAYAGPYAALPLHVGRGEITPAFRGSLHQFGGPWVAVPEPQLSSRVPVSQRVALVGFTGLSSQGPKLNEIGAGDDRALGVTRALQASLGVQLRLPHGVSLDTTAYATEMWGIIVRDTRLFIDDRPENPVNAGDEDWHGLLHANPVFRSATGRAFGGEILLRMMPRGPQFGWISASVGRSFRTTSGDLAPSDADLPLALVGVYGLGMPRGWSASVRGQLTSGLPFTPLEPVYAGIFNDPGYADIAYFDYASVPGDPNSDRYPVYGRLDLRFEKSWVRPRAEWTLYLDVYNATNQRNPLWATYNWNYTELRRAVYVPVVPALGLAVRY